VIRLFQEVNGVSVELLAGTTLIANSVNIFVQVTRYPDGTWELRSTPNSTGPWTFENAALSNTWFPFQFFGICCKYTSSNATKFYFDNIQIGTPIAEPTYPEPNNHSVVFNEIYADPTPSFGLPLAEYIELYNTAPDTLSLNNCKLVNTTNEKTLSNALLLPYNFLILCDENDVGLFENAIGIPSFTALSNSGDSLTLLNSANEIIDWVSYTIDWHTTDTALVGGISLERINPYFPCGNSSNWASSIHALGGTPNAPNSVLQTEIDVLPPQVQSVVWTDQQIQITWNEFIESSNAQGTFDGNELPLVIEGSNLFFVIPNWNISDTLINILLENISDCWGNTTDTLLTLLHYPSPQFGEVVINEILADPTPVLHGPSAEFIELLNTSNHILSLHSCSLNEKELETDVVIMPREKLILGDADESMAFLSFENKILFTDFPSLTNSGMSLAFQCNGVLIDSVTYSISWFETAEAAGGGISLERMNPYQPCSTALNWKECNPNLSCTPGETNSHYTTEADQAAPQFQYAENIHNETLVLHFNEPIQSAEAIIQLDTQWIDTLYLTSPLTRIEIPFPALQDSGVHQLQIQNVSDCSGNVTIAECSFGLIDFIHSPQFKLNEVLFNPHVGGYDFVELANPTNRCQSIHELRINNETESYKVTSSYRFLLPHSYLSLTENPKDIVTTYPLSPMQSQLSVAFLPSFNDDAGLVILSDSSGNRIEELAYNNSMHFSLLEDVEGVSLERISPDRPASDSSNWHSAAYAVGFATPGYSNSQFLDIPTSHVNLALSSEIFSPDNDGYQDVLTFTIQNENPDQVVNLHIYSWSGERVATVLHNEQITSNRIVSWDGLRSDGAYLPVGIYLAVLEMFTPESTSNFIIKDFVIAKKWQ
jgi:hypothetical protein